MSNATLNNSPQIAADAANRCLIGGVLTTEQIREKRKLRAPILSRAERTLAAHKASIPLPVQPKDQCRVDEKYPLRGYRSIDARMGVNWGEDDP